MQLTDDWLTVPFAYKHKCCPDSRLVFISFLNAHGQKYTFRYFMHFDLTLKQTMYSCLPYLQLPATMCP